jgi:hypothetical protein
VYSGDRRTKVMAYTTTAPPLTLDTWIREDPHWYLTLPTPSLLNLQFIQANADGVAHLTVLVTEQAAQVRLLRDQVTRLQDEVRVAQYTILKLEQPRTQPNGRVGPRAAAPTRVKDEVVPPLVASVADVPLVRPGLTDNQVAAFLTAWEQEYLCAAYLSRTRTCTDVMCPRLHNRTPRDVLIQELHLVYAKRTLEASVFFHGFYPGTAGVGPYDHRQTTVQTVARMLSHVQHLCG